MLKERKSLSQAFHGKEGAGMKKIAVVGSMNMDYVMQVSHMPKVGETLLSWELKTNPGGKGANQAYAAAKLGGSVTMLGAVGTDGAGETLRENLKSAGVETSHIRQIAGETTGSAFICVDSTGDNSIVAAQGANLRVDLPYLQENLETLLDCDILVLQLEIPLETVVFAAQKAKERGKLVILDPAPARQDLPPELYACVDFLKPNEGEAAQLSGLPEGDPEAAAAALLEKGVGNVLITLGGEGAFLLEKDGKKTYFSAPKNLSVVDTTAAGDCFTAAFACRLAAGASTEEAVRFAISASSLSVTRKGAQPSLPTLEEVERWKKGSC